MSGVARGLVSGLVSFKRSPKTAAHWFAARREGTDEKLERQFAAWLAQDPLHGEDYALSEIAWEVCGDAVRQMKVATPPRATRARWPRWVAAAALLTAAVAVVTGFWPSPTLNLATAPGEQRSVRLDDGSTVTLNTRTRMKVRLSPHAREVYLNGEAFFEVAKDPERPFTVRGTLGSARAVGTHFNVYADDGRLSVTTQEGRVLVDTAASGHGALVEAGSHAELRVGMRQAEVQYANINAALGWMNRILDVNDVPLGEVLKELSRYTVMPIRAETPQIAALRISGVLRTGDLDALQTTLGGVFGLAIERGSGEYVVTRPAHAVRH